MNKWSALRPYLFFVVLALAVGAAAGAAARAGMDTYDLLTKPPATPPDWLFPVVWTLIYLLMGIAMGRVWRAASGSARRQAAALWCVQLGVNGFWPVVFFLWQEHGAAFFLLAGLIALVLAMSAQFSRRAPAAAWLCAPYLLWLLFAAYLNLGVWLLNR